MPVIDDLSLQVQEGEIVGMVGESGSGKTMTALAVLQLLPRGGRMSGGGGAGTSCSGRIR